MEDIGTRLKLLREKRRLTQKELAEKANCSAQKISSYENGRNLIQICDFKNICNILDIDINYLIDGKKYHGKVTDNKDSQIVSAYDKLSYSDKKIVDFILFDESDNTNKNIYKFPIYDQEAAAGAGILGREGNFSMEDIKSNDIPKNAVFGIHIKGKSMEPEIPDRSIVLLDTRFEPAYLDRKYVVVEINGEVICKEFNQMQDHIWFKSINRVYSKEDRYVSDNNYRIIGTVVKIIN